MPSSSLTLTCPPSSTLNILSLLLTYDLNWKLHDSSPAKTVSMRLGILSHLSFFLNSKRPWAVEHNGQIIGHTCIWLTVSRLYRYRVVSVTPSTSAQVSLVNFLIKRHHLEEWTHARKPGVSMDLMVPPRSFKALLRTLHKYRVPVITKIDNVQALIDEQMKQHRVLDTLPRSFDHTRYHRLDEIYSILDGVETDSELVTTYVAGTTYEGRDIRVAKVSSGGSKEAIWIDCGIHAREWVSPATCLYILDQLTSGSSEATRLLDSHDFYIMPSANPDGYEYTWTNNRIWRKNRVPYGSLGCHGTDPNRNFDSDFGGPGTSNSPCSDIYHGPSAFSEKESQAIRDSVTSHRPRMFFTLHSYSQLWMTPYGYTHSLPANYDEQHRVAGVGVNALTAVHGTRFNMSYMSVSFSLYPAAGGSSDWAYDSAGIQYAYALELRDTGNYGFLLPPEQILPTGEETFVGIVAAIDAAK
ncbi:carboxypeptidase B-like [Portunus trituberculatus]|uniref:carboxypeptidase B-like n=1 Tax=Portunus trituberculatus TaxID=210409 RepID=UPI001E1CCF50|nr:carboxypeptidase B-like [Portunus trituberculatus]